MPKAKKHAVASEYHAGLELRTPIGDGNHQVESHVTNFATFAPARREQAQREHANRGARPGGNAPDKRVRIDPAPCDIPPRTGGPVLF